LKSKKCWNPKAELKTSREYGFGLGQITIAYDSSGKERFNNFKEARKLDPLLKNWQFEDRYNARYQLLTLIKTDFLNYKRVAFAFSESDRLAFTLVAYNSGLAGIFKDRRLASLAKHNPDKWWNNVELDSTKSKKPVGGYGKSFFEISREYPRNILLTRSVHYIGKL
jgi:hypothetical protein